MDANPNFLDLKEASRGHGSPELQVDCSRQRREGWGTAGRGRTPITWACLKNASSGEEQQVDDLVKGERVFHKAIPLFSLDNHEVLTVDLCDSKILVYPRNMFDQSECFPQT